MCARSSRRIARLQYLGAQGSAASHVLGEGTAGKESGSKGGETGDSLRDDQKDAQGRVRRLQGEVEGPAVGGRQHMTARRGHVGTS